MYVTMSVDIETSLERVWRFLVKLDRAKRWFHVLTSGGEIPGDRKRLAEATD